MLSFLSDLAINYARWSGDDRDLWSFCAVMFQSHYKKSSSSDGGEWARHGTSDADVVSLTCFVFFFAVHSILLPGIDYRYCPTMYMCNKLCQGHQLSGSGGARKLVSRVVRGMNECTLTPAGTHQSVPIHWRGRRSWLPGSFLAPPLLWGKAYSC